MYPSSKPASRQEMLGGLQTSKETPMIASAMQLWQIHLGVGISLIPHQDVAEMFVNMVPKKAEAAAKDIIRGGELQVHKMGSVARESCLGLHTKRCKEQLDTQ